MLEKNFIPPDVQTATRETTRRLALIEEFMPLIESSITGLLMCGSMATGPNFSVTERSDIDLLLIVNQESVKNLASTGFFEAGKLEAALDAYSSGIIQQFSLPFDLRGVSMECHFWDESAYIDSATMVTASTPRLRSSMSPSADYAYAFDGSESVVEFTGEEIEGHIVSPFQSYRVIEGKRYFCRPVTNILGCVHIYHGHALLEPVVAAVWRNVIRLLREEAPSGVIDLDVRNVINCMPGKNKLSPEAREWIVARTKRELEDIEAV